MATHTIEPNEQTLHGFFSPEHPPALTVDPGDTVRFRTLDAGWGLEPPTGDRERPRRQAVTAHGPPHGHALCGPVAVRGAEPGMTLVVRIEALRVGAWGWTFGSDLAGGSEVLHRWVLDPDRLIGRNQHGHALALRPFLGVMGNAPAEPGRHPTIPPYPTGGNLDCKELVAGSTLYLPVAVPGALFSTGDGHARQGDGEISGTAIECPFDEAVLTFDLRDDLHLAMPRAETPAGWLTFGIGPDMNTATIQARDGMIDLIIERHGLTRPDAVALASLVVDLRVTQIVNQLCGVHAVLPHDAWQ
ncbi:MAG TPA: acetamidase/formamidase family protein [Roseiflexaceae bacterium]|nr:acetamidase/formamidase family protein [Roseiflexaceae bacterium]